jgi:hypothetical protein
VLQPIYQKAMVGFISKKIFNFVEFIVAHYLKLLEHLITAFDEGYISQDQLDSFKQQIESCGKSLNGYINYLKKVANPPDEN